MYSRNKMFECNQLWRTLYIGNNGLVNFCCYWENNECQTEQDDLLNYPHLVKARKDAVAGIQPKGCSTCVAREQYGANVRERSKELFSNPSNFNAILAPDQIEMIDVRVGNTCNFMCTICNSTNSHLIAKEEGRKDFYISWTSKQSNSIFDLLSRCINLKHIIVAGGEPFYNKSQLIKILQSVYNRRNNLTVQILTNASIYDEDILSLLKEFKITIINLSIDSLSQSNELQRWKADNKQLLDNFFKFISFLDKPYNNYFNINPAISNLTLPDIQKLFTYFDRQERINRIVPNYVTDPAYMSINTLRLNYRLNLANKLEKITFNKVRNYSKFVNYLKTAPETNKYYNIFVKKFKTYKIKRKLFIPQEFYEILAQ